MKMTMFILCQNGIQNKETARIKLLFDIIMLSGEIDEAVFHVLNRGKANNRS